MGGYTNMTLAPANVSSAAAFAIGFTASLISSALDRYTSLPCWAVGAVDGAILEAGNQWLAGDFSGQDLGTVVATAASNGLMEYFTKGGCFVAGTLVLEGDQFTFTPIEEVRVGDRLATDGGVANSLDGQAAGDVNATVVDVTTWRLVKVTASGEWGEEWIFETLQPVTRLEAYDVDAGEAIPLEWIIDVAEMGAPAGRRKIRHASVGMARPLPTPTTPNTPHYLPPLGPLSLYQVRSPSNPVRRFNGNVGRSFLPNRRGGRKDTK